MHNIKAVAIKEFLHLFRDKRTLSLIVFMPFVQLMIYGYAVNTDVKHLATAVYDQDRTYLSRRLVDTFVQSAYFDVVENVNSLGEMRKLIDRGKVKTGLIIPPKFSRDVLSSKGTQVQLIIDGTDSNPANAALADQSVDHRVLRAEGRVGARLGFTHRFSPAPLV